MRRPACSEAVQARSTSTGGTVVVATSTVPAATTMTARVEEIVGVLSARDPDRLTQPATRLVVDSASGA